MGACWLAGGGAVNRPHPSELGFDGKPTLNHNNPAAEVEYANLLDVSVPGWFEADETAMYAELAAEAVKRREGRS